jgi:putative ATP-binding cassette transporter
MSTLKSPINRETWDRFVRMVKALVSDREVGRRALFYFFGLILFLFLINGLNVVNSYVGRDFMTAIADRDRAGFWLYAFVYIGVFAASTVVSVTSRYMEESLGLLWRRFFTGRMFRRYADHRVYFRLAESAELGNPDQRIAEDVRAFTATSLSFFLMLLNGILTAIAFSGVLWSISSELFTVAVVYASAGTYLAIRLGRPLVRLNYDQSDKEGDFRSSVIQLRENADLVALARREAQLTFKTLRNLEGLAENFGRIIRINRNVGFFTTGYNWLIQIIPALIVAPLFIDGKVEFGVITQSAIAFTQLLGAFSLIVTQFQSLSSFAAVITRLGVFSEVAFREIRSEVAAEGLATEDWQAENRVVYRGLTLRSPRSARILVNGLEGEIPAGRRVLIHGPDETARSALFRATAGLWPEAEGQVIRPPLDQILFVTERPYLSTGTLRELFMRPWPDRKPETPEALAEFNSDEFMVPDARILDALDAVGLENLVSRFGGLDKQQDWDSFLPLREQQLLVIARVIETAPCFVFLDRPDTALNPEQLDRVLSLFTERSISYVVFGGAVSLPDRYDAALELEADGAWQWQASPGGGR